MNALTIRAMGGAAMWVLCSITLSTIARAQGVVAGTTVQAASVAPGFSTLPVAPSGDDYLVTPGDVLDVQVVGLDQAARKVRVDTSGVITLPLLGAVPVAGVAPRQVEAMIADLLRQKYMQDPQVSVFVEESVSQRFSIQGAVRTPNVFPLKGRMTLLQALAMSGGTTKVADLANVRILRGEGAAQQNLVFDAEKIGAGGVADPAICGNDVIIVEASAARTAFYETVDTLRGLLSFGTVR